MEATTQATITCPACGTRALEPMPQDACQYRYVCTGCGELLTAKPGDCCVFCSYADAVCPPMQRSQDPVG
ncbi:MAG: GDCCVxC domain-containing (seleno)protein [Solirubrobacteraceae bacterium]